MSAIETRILTFLTRTPLHIGAGPSIGAIDQPVQRERHTGLVTMPGSGIKGVFADYWNDGLTSDQTGSAARGDSTPSAWLFGSDDARSAAAGALQFSEGRLLAFPVRSGRGGYAWVTSPLLLQRAARDKVIPPDAVPVREPADEEAIFKKGTIDLSDGDKPCAVLEEYCLIKAEEEFPAGLGKAMQNLVTGDEVWADVASRLVIVSNGMMSYFTTTACEVAQHVRISDVTGTAVGGALFNQENVPSETLFYALLNAFPGRGKFHAKSSMPKTAADAIAEFQTKLPDGSCTFQFGSGSSTGLGFCTVTLTPVN